MQYGISEPVLSISLFLLFKELEIKKQIINKIASHTFGIYLFHESPLTRIILWKNILEVPKQFSNTYFIFYALISIHIIFIVGMLIDIIREKYFEEKINKYVKNVLIYLQMEKE